jgi:hypothetical protein
LITFNNPGGVPLSALHTAIHGDKLGSLKAGQTLMVKWDLDGIYNDGKYLVSAEISNLDDFRIFSRLQDGCEFSVVGWDMPTILLHPKNRYTLEITE